MRFPFSLSLWTFDGNGHFLREDPGSHVRLESVACVGRRPGEVGVPNGVLSTDGSAKT